MIDTHAHLQFPEINTNLDVIIERAKGVGITCIVVPSTSLDDSITTVEVVSNNPIMRAAIGIHPTEVNNFKSEQIIDLTSLAESKNVVAIGEVGLDYYHSTEFMVEQVELFRQMIELAKLKKLPLIIHSREAFEDTHRILKSECKNYPLVIHSFTESLENARSWIDLGYYISFNGIITYPKNHSLREVVTQVPLESILLETDSPYLAPQSQRGKICEPSYILEIAEMIAVLKNIPLEQVVEVTDYNAKKLFNL